MGCGSTQQEKPLDIAGKESANKNNEQESLTTLKAQPATKQEKAEAERHSFEYHRKRPEVEALDITNKPIDYANCIELDYTKCIGCHNCARACDEWQGFHVLTKGPVKIPPYVKSHYGNIDINDDTHRIKLITTDCVGCGQCVVACPMGALEPYNELIPVKEALSSKLLKVAVVAPATRVGLAEGMGMPVGSSCERELVYYLRQLGFEKVFDNLFGADICTREDLSEVLQARKLNKGPVFTSCCPAWIRLAEEKYADLLPRISTAKSPEGITCSLIKQYVFKSEKKRPKDIFVCGFMPCTSKKNECVREELMIDGVPECDYNLTVRELVEWLKQENIAFSEEHEEQLKGDQSSYFDAPFNEYSGSAYIYGRTAGVTEAVLRQICALNGETFNPERMTSKTVFEDEATLENIKIIEFPSGNELYKFAVAAGGTAVRAAADMVRQGELQCDCIEMMCCPSGCISGGGEPKNMKKPEIPERAKGLEAADAASAYSSSAQNKMVDEIYEKLGNDAHKLFHTKFVAWDE